MVRATVTNVPVKAISSAPQAVREASVRDRCHRDKIIFMNVKYRPHRQSSLSRLLCVAALVALPPSLAQARDQADVYPAPVVNQATVYVTARDTGDRLRAGSPLHFADLPQPDEQTPCIFLDPTRRFQTIVGFGGAFTDAAAETFAKMPPAKQQEILTAYFSPDGGLGYTLGRTNINSCDFSSDTYSYDDVAGDTKLTHFSIAHDLQYRVPFIKAALAASHDRLRLFASPWSPPAWMKTNNDMAHGGKLRPEDRQAWADYYVRFIRAYQQVGVPIWGLTIQNEPLASQSWESCLYTAQDEHDFVRGYLGPTLQKAHLSDVKVMIWDHNRGLLYQQAQGVLSDPKAAQYVWGTAFHWYAGDNFDNPEMVHEAFPDKNLLFTEGSRGFRGTAEGDNWPDAEHYGQSELLDLNHWSTGWTDWNLLLDERGGPNHVGNFCSAPIIADTKTGELHYLPSFYYLGHFSKFIRPGAQRIACTSDTDALLATAFINPDNTLAAVVLNLTNEARDYKVWIDGRAVSTHSPAHSLETVVLGP